MKSNEYKVLFELIRGSTVIDAIEPHTSLEENDLKFGVKLSMSSYPILSIESSHQQLNSILINYAKKDIIRYSVASGNSNNYNVMFEGEFFSTNIQGTSLPDSLILDVKSIHSFYRLSLFELLSEKIYNDISFKDFVADILKTAEINIVVRIEPKISDIKIYGISCNTNLFRVFKEICLMVDATVRFNSNNTVDIKSRNSSLKEFEEQEVLTINKKDITSFTMSDNLIR